MIDAYIGLGSNVGDPAGNLRSALQALDEMDGTDVISVSHVYESEPWGVEDQPAFLNAVAKIRTTLRADQLLGTLKDIEVDLGRRPGPRYGPRVLDLDLLLVGDEEWQSAELTVPHPKMAERDFVLTPLLSIAPDAKWPDGTAITREGPLVGRVVADRGRLPEVDPAWHVWEARWAQAPEGCGSGGCGTSCAVPGDEMEAWVEVAKGRAAGGEIDILESKLRSADIPFELTHRELGDGMGFLAGPATVMVPQTREAEARSVLYGEPGSGPMALPRQPESPPQRPAWFMATLKVFSWMFMAYWVIRILARGGF